MSFGPIAPLSGKKTPADANTPFVVDLDGLYPPTPKFVVFRHTDCCVYWLGIGESSNDTRRCPKCKAVEVMAMAAYSTFVEADEYKACMIQLDFQRKVQAAYVMRLTEMMEQKKIAEILPNFTILPSIAVVESYDPLSHADFFKKWLFWSYDFPLSEVLGYHKYVNMMSELSFYPNPKETVIGQFETELEKKKDN